MNADSAVSGKFGSNSSDYNELSVSETPIDLFRDCDCGEPLLSQRIVINFIPTDEDSDTIQRKCVHFWDYIARNIDLKSLETIPVSFGDALNVLRNVLLSNQDYEIGEETKSDVSGFIPMKPASDNIEGETTAVSMLELVAEKGLIDRAFEGKLPQSYCSLGLREYSENDSLPKPAVRSEVVDGRYTKRAEHSQAAVKKMCQKLETWDLEHPQYMEPPGHSQTLIYCKKRKN